MSGVEEKYLKYQISGEHIKSASWTNTTLGALADYINGFAFKPSDWSERGTLIVRIAQMTNRDTDADYFTGTLPESFKINDGELLFSWSATLLAQIWNRGPAYLNQHIYKVNPKPGVDRDFLYQLLNFEVEHMVRQTHGTTMTHIKRSELLPYRVCVPASEEQTRIAAILNTLDAAIKKSEALIAKLKQIRAGMLHDLLTCGVDENGELRDPLKNPNQFHNCIFGAIPKTWTIETLGERLARCKGYIQTGPFGSQLHASEYTTQGIPVIMPQDIDEGIIYETKIARISTTKASELSRHNLQINDLIFARRGDLERCAVITTTEQGWLCGTGCLLMRFKPTELLPEWLSLSYRHNIGQRQIAARAVGTTMVNLNTGLLNHLVFGFPRVLEQSAIIDLISGVDTDITREKQHLQKMLTMKSGLSNDLLTGQVRVTPDLELP